MPIRTITVDGRSWQVYPSGFTTVYVLDEYGLIFVAGEGTEREVRVTRFSPTGDRGRDRAIGEMSDAQLAALLASSQSSEMSPELGYRQSPLAAAAQLPPRLAAGPPTHAPRLGTGADRAGRAGDAR
ncbi:MAG TPA: hypothetical protein VEZ47_13760 [Gemmatirosa sp.]|jgi:hypothetical protein|nr:hypothetical protein [Gemmatirosa sp.]